ncbi:unnamed protein product, partial [Ectocarpus sp. 12 AP-2014]
RTNGVGTARYRTFTALGNVFFAPAAGLFRQFFSCVSWRWCPRVSALLTLTRDAANLVFPDATGGAQDPEIDDEVLRVRLPAGGHDQGSRCGPQGRLPHRGHGGVGTAAVGPERGVI